MHFFITEPLSPDALISYPRKAPAALSHTYGTRTNGSTRNAASCAGARAQPRARPGARSLSVETPSRGNLAVVLILIMTVGARVSTRDAASRGSDSCGLRSAHLPGAACSPLPPAHAARLIVLDPPLPRRELVSACDNPTKRASFCLRM